MKKILVMKKIYTVILLLSVLIPSGCKKYLDIQPKGYVIPSKVEDFERLLNGDAITRPLPTLLDQLSDDYYDATLNRNNYQVNSDNQTYFWDANIFSSASDFQYSCFYNLLYANIYQFNAIINGIDAAADGTPARKSIAKARAQALRALSYWYLVNLYSKTYAASSSMNDPGVPLVVSNDINSKLPGRGTVQETYDFILKDLMEAIPALPTSAPDPFQLTKAGGYGILARAYLMKNDYTKAGEAAGQALAFNNKLLDYNTEYATYSADGVNFIYPKQDSKLKDKLSMPENIFIQYYTYTGGMAYKAVAPITEKMFPDQDLRRIYFAPSSIYDEDPSKWDGTYNYLGYQSYAYSIGISTPEMYLIRAEASARNGKVQDAMNDINTLRKSRIKNDKYQDLVASGNADALKIVLDERRKELLFKGVRWFDMRRLSSDPTYGFTAKHYFNDGTFVELAPNSLRYVLRLPETAITGDITQNP